MQSLQMTHIFKKPQPDFRCPIMKLALRANGLLRQALGQSWPGLRGWCHMLCGNIGCMLQERNCPCWLIQPVDLFELISNTRCTTLVLKRACIELSDHRKAADIQSCHAWQASYEPTPAEDCQVMSSAEHEPCEATSTGDSGSHSAAAAGSSRAATEHG